MAQADKELVGAIPIAAPAAAAPTDEPTAHGRHGRARLHGRDLTTGSIPRNLWFLAWPSMVSGLLQTVDHVAELVWAGLISVQAIANIGVAQSWTSLFNTGRMGFDVATRAMVSRAVGAGEQDTADHIATQALVFNLYLSVLVTVFGWYFAPNLLRVLGVSETVVEAGSLYMQLRFVATSTFTMLYASGSILQAAGDSVMPMKAQFISRCIHIPLSPFLMFGWLGLPNLGLAGSPVAATFAQTLAAIATIWVLASGQSRVRISMRHIAPDLPLYWRMIKLGAPASWTTGERSLAQLLLTGVVAPFGDITLAAYAVTQRMQGLVNLGQHGIGQAAGVMAGQNLGAKSVERAMSSTRWALVFSAVMSLIVAVVMFVEPTWVIMLFTRDAALIEETIPWLRIMVIGFGVMSAGNVFTQVFNTSGDTLLPMLVNLGSIWLIQQPFARMFSGSNTVDMFGFDFPLPVTFDFGSIGIAWAMILAIAVRLIFFVPYFLWGPWWRKRVL